jgi:coenzyme F420-dependent glucose-6-phosphate dehydrogenase
MQAIGYTLSSEEHGPNELAEYGHIAEEVGFDFLSISDHFHPWIDAQGQSPLVWNVIGALSQVTKKVKIMTGVTCPILRYHPVIIAQAAATSQVQLEGRFMLGVGTGENLNEHVIGAGWPEIDIRREMLNEAVELMRKAWEGGYKSYYGNYYSMEDARIYTLPDQPIPILYAAAGTESIEAAGEYGDALVTTGPNKELIDKFNASGGKDKPIYGQVNVCYAKSADEAKKIVLEVWPLSGFPDPANYEYRLPAYFENLAQAIPDDKKLGNTPLGTDVQGIMKSIKQYEDAGFTHIYMHNIGPYQEEFLQFAEKELLPKLK